MYLIIIDTEYTAWEGSQARKWSLDWEHPEIFHCAALVAQISPHHLREITQVDYFVRPTHNPILSEYVKKLTSIDQSQVDQGMSFAQLMTKIDQLQDAFPGQLWSWGNEASVFRKNARLNNLKLEGFTTYDLRPVFQAFGIDTRINSGNLYRKMGIKANLKAHAAHNDTRSLFLSLQKLHQQAPQILYNHLKEQLGANL